MNRRLLCLVLALMLLRASLPFNAIAASQRIRFSPKVRLIYNNSTLRLSPSLSGIKRASLKWKSSQKSVASVSAKGLLKAKKSGLTVITAYAGKVKGRCGIISLPRKITLQVGQTKRLPYASVEKYSMANGAVANVSKKGAVTGRKAGNTTLTVKYGSQKLNISVRVVASNPQESRVSKLSCAKTASQIVLVEYTGGSNATLSIHDKRNGFWQEIYSCAAYVGKNGIDKQREGDKRTPTGTFNLTTPFGIQSDPGANMAYTKVTKYHYWCGTSSSKYYNQLIDTRVINRERTSSDEYLINYGAVYNYCMFIDYNVEGTPGKGSCIFLHCTGSNAYTSGCVAIPQAAMKKVIQWAKPGVKIVIGNPI